MPALRRSDAPRPSRRGTALLAVVAALVVLSMAAMALVHTTVATGQSAVCHAHHSEARLAAESAAKLAAESLWTGFRTWLAGAAPTPAAFRDYAATLGLANQAGVGTPLREDWLGSVALAAEPDGTLRIGDAVVRELWVHREDVAQAVRITVTATAAMHLGERMGDHDDPGASVTRVWSIEPPRWDGLDFALLANNVNCIMCHTEVDSAARWFNRDGDLFGTFERVRVGSIESFQFRDDPDSTVAGTTYIGGTAFDASGRTITDWAHLPLESARMHSGGRLFEDAFGQLVHEDLSPADPSSPMPFENLYVDYFGFPEAIDGVLPSRFPSPFPDNGGFDVATGENVTEGAGNRVVDQAEYDSTVSTFEGTLSGGVISVVASGDRVTTSAELTAFLAGNTAALGAQTTGQVLLVGTESDPIRLDGPVAIDGDVVLSGYVTGEGALWARGNVYVRGDVRYVDAVSGGERVFGRDEAGGVNALAITCGGNIVVGDVFRPAFGAGAAANGLPSGGWNFTLEEAGIFNRREWIKTQPMLPGQAVRTQTGTTTRVTEQGEWRGTGVFYEAPVYTRVQTGTRSVPIYETRILEPATQYRPAVTERVLVGYRDEPIWTNVQTGTVTRERTEWVVTGTTTVEVPVYEWISPMLVNPDYAGPGYLPRYYAFDDDTVVPIYNKGGWLDPSTGLWISPERAGDWDLSKLTLADPRDPSDPILYRADGTPKAVVSTLMATDEWITDAMLRELISRGLAEREASEAFRIDALLYSSNSIFGVIPEADGTNGQLEVSGAVIGADVGLLGPRGTRINFDERLQALLDIRDNEQVVMRRMLAVAAPMPAMAAP